MNFLNRMYGRSAKREIEKSSVNEKNPNRVSGGLKGQGLDHYLLISEDGMEQQVPSHRYVQSLEEQLRKHRAAINVLERKLSRIEKDFESTKTTIQKIRAN